MFSISKKMPMNPFDFKADILKQELELLERRISNFDDLRHRTKQMTLTLWLAAVGVSLTIPSRLLLWLAVLVPVPFWYFDARYNAFQKGFSRRFWAIRAFIRDEKFTAPDGTFTTLTECLTGNGFKIFPVPDYYGNKTFKKKEHTKETSVFRNAITRRMLTFYLPLVLGALLLFLIFNALGLNA